MTPTPDPTIPGRGTALVDRVARLADRMEQQTEKDDWR